MNQPWLDHYDSGVPRTIGTYPEKTLVDFVAEHSHERGDAPAVLFKGRTLTWRELDRASDPLVELDGVSIGLLPGFERERFLAEHWPRVHATIRRLGLTPEELLNGGKKEER